MHMLRVEKGLTGVQAKYIKEYLHWKYPLWKLWMIDGERNDYIKTDIDNIFQEALLSREWKVTPAAKTLLYKYANAFVTGVSEQARIAMEKDVGNRVTILPRDVKRGYYLISESYLGTGVTTKCIRGCLYEDVD